MAEKNSEKCSLGRGGFAYLWSKQKSVKHEILQKIVPAVLRVETKGKMLFFTGRFNEFLHCIGEQKIEIKGF